MEQITLVAAAGMAAYMRIEKYQANIMQIATIADVRHEDALLSNDDDD